MAYRQSLNDNLGVIYNAGNAFSTKVMTDLTFIFVWKPTDVSAQGLLRLMQAGPTAVGGFNPYSDGKIYYGAGAFFTASTASYTASDGWRIDVFRKTSAGTTIPRHSYYLYSEGVWHHTDMASTLPDATASPGFTTFKFWTYSATEKVHGSQAGVAIVSSQLSDGACVGLEKGIAEWVTRGYDFIVSHQESPNESTSLNVAPNLFGTGTGTASFSSFGEFGGAGFDWPQGYSNGGLPFYNPPAPWSYAKQAQGNGTASMFQQRATFKGTRNDAAGWTIGNQLSLPGNGSVTAVWFYPPDGFIGDFTWRLYYGDRTVSGPLIATGTILSANYDHAGGWQRFSISPVDVSAKNFMICYDAPGSGNGSYIYGPMDGDHFPNATFSPDSYIFMIKGCFASSHTRPDTDSNNVFGIDVEVTPPGISFDATKFLPFFQ